MISFDLQKVEDLAKIGVLLANGKYPIQGTNYIREDGTREHFAFYNDEVKHYLTNLDNLPEYKSAYLMAVFMDEARKQVPLVEHTLPNEQKILIAANTPKEELLKICKNL